MDFLDVTPNESISLFVKHIWIVKSNSTAHTSLPFFADGYPGLLFQQTKNGLTVHPHNQKMPELFLYGQTIRPITLEIDGPYQIIIFQLYPFVLRAFWKIAPASINDSCYHLDGGQEIDLATLTAKLSAAGTAEKQIEELSCLLLRLFEEKKNGLDFIVRQGTQAIIDSKGQRPIQSIAQEENINIRTFERRFLKETGLSPKQFAKIIQFQASLHQLKTHDYKKLNDIVYANGFSDQSHFIRVFKAFTGETPRAFQDK
ncbi:MAG: helix-turn-helix domain-containing protein [Sphingobacterium sp.]